MTDLPADDSGQPASSSPARPAGSGEGLRADLERLARLAVTQTEARVLLRDLRAILDRHPAPDLPAAGAEALCRRSHPSLWRQGALNRPCEGCLTAPESPAEPVDRHCPSGHVLDSYSDWCEDCPPAALAADLPDATRAKAEAPHPRWFEQHLAEHEPARDRDKPLVTCDCGWAEAFDQTGADWPKHVALVLAREWQYAQSEEALPTPIEPCICSHLMLPSLPPKDGGRVPNSSCRAQHADSIERGDQ